MGYWGWYNINMEVTTWKDESSPFCTGGHGGARTILDFSQCTANGGKILSEGPGQVCAKQDGTHIFCGADQSSSLYKFLLQSTAGWQSDKTWISDADTTAPLDSFLCDPQYEQPPRGVGFMIGCQPASNEMGIFQVRFCPSSSDVTSVQHKIDVAGTAATGFDVQASPATPLHSSSLRGATPNIASTNSRNMLQWSSDAKYCMSVVDNDFKNGQKMQLWECAGGSGQYFEFEGSNSGQASLLKLSAAPNYCVVIDGNADSNGASIQLWQCDPAVQAQQWKRQGCGMQCPFTTLRNAAFPDKCMVVDSNKGYNGNRIQLWSCDRDERYKMWYPVG
jgi:hypothetical protein